MQKYRRAMELMEADIDDELVALEPVQGLCFGFNAVAKDVWRMLKQPRGFDELKVALLAEYEVGEDQCSADLRELLQQLAEAGLIETAA